MVRRLMRVVTLSISFSHLVKLFHGPLDILTYHVTWCALVLSQCHEYRRAGVNPYRNVAMNIELLYFLQSRRDLST